MKKALFLLSFLFIGYICNGQLKPPHQTDTLVIKSVTYNYSDILEENWPCEYILKSATHFEFGDQKFEIRNVESTWNNIVFYLRNDETQISSMTYNNSRTPEITITFSGYSFICTLCRNLVSQKPNVKQEDSESKVSIVEETTVDDFGDVEKTEPIRPKEINKKALFKSAPNFQQIDTLAPQTSSQPSDILNESHSQGTIKDGNETVHPNAHLKGRTIIGSLPKPDYNSAESGKVVVSIKVDRYGAVVEARAGVAGTTLAIKDAWDTAKKAALETQFNIKVDAPEFQYGTITYFFNAAK